MTQLGSMGRVETVFAVVSNSNQPCSTQSLRVNQAVERRSASGVALLVRTRTAGATYWCALAMTLLLAVCAFVLSFDAIRTWR